MKSFDRQRLQDYLESLVEDEMRKAIDRVSTQFHSIASNQIPADNGGFFTSYEVEIRPAITNTTIKDKESEVGISVEFDCVWCLSACVQGMSLSIEIPQEPEGEETTIINETGVLKNSWLFTNEQG